MVSPTHDEVEEVPDDDDDDDDDDLECEDGDRVISVDGSLSCLSCSFISNSS
ncbi:unnamed protein product [Schistosoma mattheei]|uniref:Uncharacterized protein n=1 Tax=Schistosoma mattheei TaxID=31246 RepID=A0A3P8GLW9_9TREM|nr:unnamed protein product [Schistosoma mattheei]